MVVILSMSGAQHYQISDIQTTHIIILLLDCCSRFFFRACMSFFYGIHLEVPLILGWGVKDQWERFSRLLQLWGLIWYTITYEWILTLLFIKIRWWWEEDPYCFWLNGLVGLPAISSYCMPITFTCCNLSIWRSLGHFAFAFQMDHFDDVLYI